MPYDPRPAGAPPVVSVYTDAYGRRFQVDAAGRQYIEQNGQLIPHGTVPGTYALASPYDSDGDGFANQYDRFPYDSRYR